MTYARWKMLLEVVALQAICTRRQDSQASLELLIDTALLLLHELHMKLRRYE